MFNKICSNKYFIKIILFCIIIFEFLILRKFLGVLFVYIDDVGHTLYSSYNGILAFPWILDVFFCTVCSIFLKIHPSYFKGVYFSCIETVLLLFFAFILNELLFIKKEKNIKSYIPAFIFSSSLVVFHVVDETDILFLYDGFFRWFLASFLNLCLFYILIKQILIDINSTISNKVFIFILTFICCILSEQICVSTLIGMTSYIIFRKFFIKEKDNLKILYYILFTVLLSALFLYFTGGYSRHLAFEEMYSKYFVEIFKMIPEFSLKYLQYVFWNHKFEYIILFIQSIILYKYIKRNNIVDNSLTKTAALCFSFLIGELIFFYMLIIAGKASYYIEGKFWLMHSNLHVSYNLLLDSINFILFYFILEYKLIKKAIIVPVACILFVIINYFNYVNFDKFETRFIFLREETYKIEKILRVSSMNNQIAYLDKNILTKVQYIESFLENHMESYDVEINRLYLNSPYIEFMNSFPYGNKIDKGYMFVDEETALREQKKNGIYFSEEELKHINFNNLINKDFYIKQNINRH